MLRAVSGARVRWGSARTTCQSCSASLDASLKSLDDKLVCGSPQRGQINPQTVFANREVRMQMITNIGFDYDYTLAHYTSKLHNLIFDLAKTYMVENMKYPEELRGLTYDPSFPLRGLFYDRKKGILLKLNATNYIDPDSVYHGRHKLSREEINDLYHGLHVQRGYMDNLASFGDLFCLSETALLSEVIQLLNDSNFVFDSEYVYQDIRQAFERIHVTGILHNAIMANVPRYIQRPKGLFPLLQRWRNAGKNLFVITNSPYPFVDCGLRYLLHDELPDGEHWSSLFDVVVCSAAKPTFYESDRPFRKVMLNEGDRLSWKKVTSFRPHGVYVHGNVKAFSELTGYDTRSTLYIGDNLGNDLVVPSRSQSWKTCAILRELEQEVEIQNSPGYAQLRHEIEQLRTSIYDVYLLRDRSCGPACADMFEAPIREIKAQYHRTFTALKSLHNENFGAMLKSNGLASNFALNLARFADVYTSKIENFGLYHDNAAFFPRPVALAHDWSADDNCYALPVDAINKSNSVLTFMEERRAARGGHDVFGARDRDRKR